MPFIPWKQCQNYYVFYVYEELMNEWVELNGKEHI